MVTHDEKPDWLVACEAGDSVGDRVRAIMAGQGIAPKDITADVAKMCGFEESTAKLFISNIRSGAVNQYFRSGSTSESRAKWHKRVAGFLSIINTPKGDPVVDYMRKVSEGFTYVSNPDLDDIMNLEIEKKLELLNKKDRADIDRIIIRRLKTYYK